MKIINPDIQETLQTYSTRNMKKTTPKHILIRESIWQNSTPVSDKNSEQTRNRRERPQSDKDQLPKIYS